MSDNLQFYWLQDSYSAAYHLHLNKPNLTRKESYLGRVYYRDTEWWIEINSSAKEYNPGPYSNISRARLTLEEYINENSLY